MSTLIGQSKTEEPKLSFAEFLERGTPMTVAKVEIDIGAHGWLAFPELTLYCSDNRCLGPRVFKTDVNANANGRPTHLVLYYKCKNCEETLKGYSLRIMRIDLSEIFEVYKFGEDPPYGPKIPARVQTLIGSSREMFLKGLRAENLGMGIAAFAYYRRVIEAQRDQIFDQVIRVAKQMGGPEDVIADLERAQKETQFTKGVDAIKHAIPQTLFVQGQNPLTLLHSALSEGLHAEDDEECLDLAHTIRLVLTEFVDRVASALREDRDLSDAVSRLIRKAKPKAQ